VRVTEEIAHNEAMFCVPYKLAITVTKAQAVPELSKVFRQHPDLFDPDEHQDWEHYVLIAFLLFELQKGEKSFWYPYIEVLPRDADCFWRWDPKIIKQTQDPALILTRIKNSNTYKDSLYDVLKVFQSHPDVFNQKFVTEEIVRRVEAWVDTRVFGSHNLPSCALVPFADSINHSDSWI